MRGKSRQQSALATASPEVVRAAAKEEAIRQIDSILDFEIQQQAIKESRMHAFDAGIEERRQELYDKMNRF